ncbi:hypothetical protein BH23ACT3_BH23ACT3_04000 [soil metagenome]
MSLVAVLGDVATTTTLALAAAWPVHTTDDFDHLDHHPGHHPDLLFLELDPTGGSMAAWLDLPGSPTLSTVVTGAADHDWPTVAALARRSSSGVQVIPAPARSVEASRAVAEADRWLTDLFAGLERPTVLADVGDPSAASGLPPVVRIADVTIVVHRQARQSARAAAVRVERLAETVDMVVSSGSSMVLAVVGDSPFEPEEILRFVAGSYDPDSAVAPVVTLADEPLSAAVLAGRTGVSSRRLARLPLMRSAGSLATTTSVVLDAARALGPRTRR